MSYVCKKCNSTNLFTEPKGNNVGLYCGDCGAWIKWMGKDELRAFEHSNQVVDTLLDDDISNSLETYRCFDLNLDKINSIDDCKKLLNFLCKQVLGPIRSDLVYNGFSEVEDYFKK